MSHAIECPNCGEDERLLGTRDGETIRVRCEACGLGWDRDLAPSCPTCGSTEVRPAFQAIGEKSRGTQLSMQSARLIHLCPTCDAGRLNDYHRTNSPLMPAQLPTTDGDQA